MSAEGFAGAAGGCVGCAIVAAGMDCCDTLAAGTVAIGGLLCDFAASETRGVLLAFAPFAVLDALAARATRSAVLHAALACLRWAPASDGLPSAISEPAMRLCASPLSSATAEAPA